MNTGRYNLIQLLNNNEIEQIIIPEIQRDYVWRKENVLALLESIWANFKNKNTIQLNIKEGEKPVDENLQLFLSKEFSKIRYATQIGFIYAYHDVEYAGKFFLIDGQQRITTLYLLLLALYKKARKEEDFISVYFRNKQLKLDYKVREVSHDFMQNFVEHVLSKESVEFKNTSKYYQNIYETDTTTLSLSKNFDTIFTFPAFAGLKENEFTDLIDYIENYVEFNYFDTNLSEQGEQLYLYMNSRGEMLSTQEIIKTTIIKRAKDDDKKEAGRKWEEWQNFFWKHRKGLDENGIHIENPNADKGFEAFLKWATIIHMCSNKEESIKLKPAEEKNNKIQTLLEIKEDYIRYEPESKWIKQYQKENDSFDIHFLGKLFSALQYLQEKKSERLVGNNLLESPYFRKNWLIRIGNMIDYVTVCGVIFYLSKCSTATVEDVDRLGMYLKNICYHDTNVDNSAGTLIRVLEGINHLFEQGRKDIIFLEDVAAGSKRIVNSSDEKILSCYRGENRKEWEEAIWNITKQSEFANFLDGDYSFFFECSKDNEGGYSVDEFVKCRDLFYEKVYKRKTEDDLRRYLLAIGDYSQYDGGGSSNLEEYMERWTFNTNDKKSWRNIFSDKAEIVRKYLNPLYEYNSEPYQGSWREAFVDDESILNYMEQKKFLWTVNGRIVLLHRHQASIRSSRELQIQLLHTKLPKSWVDTYNICVQEFDFVSGEIILIEANDSDHLFMEIQYMWKSTGGEWHLYVGYGTDEEKSKLEEVITLGDNKAENWIPIDDGNKKRMKQPFYIDKRELSIMQNVDRALSELWKLIEY